MANAHIMLGSNPKTTTGDYLKGTTKIVDTLTETPTGLKFIAGGSGLTELLNLDNQALQDAVWHFIMRMILTI